MANTYTDKLNLRMPGLGDTGWNTPLNEDIEMVDTALAPVLAGNVVISGCTPSDGGGLDVDYTAGTVVVAGTERTISASSETATADSKNYLYVDDTGTVQISTTAPTGDFVLLSIVDAGASALDNVADVRNFAEGAAALDLSYTPDHYDPDTSETKEIEQHLAGIDAQLGLMLAGDLIVNGSMQVAQQGASFTGLTNGGTQYTLDQWRFAESGSPTGVVDVKQTADHPLTPNGFCLEVDVTTAQSSPAAVDHIRIDQIIEGQFLQFLCFGNSGAKNLVLSFYIKSAQTGAHAIAFYHQDADESYVASVTVSSANTWEFKTIVLPGHTTGAFGNDNNGSLQVWFPLITGSNYETTTGSWVSGIKASFSGAVNILSSTSNNLRIAEVRLQPGSVYISAPPRPYPIEEFLCKRYFERIGDPTVDSDLNIGTGQAISTTTVIVPILWQPKRATPSSATTGSGGTTWTYTRATGTRLWASATSLAGLSRWGCHLTLTGSSLVAGNASRIDLRQTSIDIDATL